MNGKKVVSFRHIYTTSSLPSACCCTVIAATTVQLRLTTHRASSKRRIAAQVEQATLMLHPAQNQPVAGLCDSVAPSHTTEAEDVESAYLQGLKVADLRMHAQSVKSVCGLFSAAIRREADHSTKGQSWNVSGKRTNTRRGVAG